MLGRAERKMEERKSRIGMGGREEGVFEKRRESVEVAGGRGEWKVIQRAGGDRNRQRRERQERIKELKYNK